MSELEKDLEQVDLDLEEAKETGTDAVAADPVTPEGGQVKKTNADKKAKKGEEKADDIEDDVKVPQGSNTGGMAESIERLFNGSELSEDFKTSAVETLAVCLISSSISSNVFATSHEEEATS